MIYLDNAATTKVRAEVLEAMLPYLQENYGNPSSVYALGREAHHALDVAREQVRAALNAKQAREIFFTGCGTESDNWAICGAAHARREKGRHIVTSKVEHHAVLDTCRALEAEGYAVTYLDVDAYGQVSPETVRAAMRKDTVLVSVMLANNEVGTINPVAEIAKIAHEHGALFHTDAVQAVGHVAIDVQAMGIDMLSLSGHKFHAPKGVGALYIRQGTEVDRYMHGGGQERGRRSGTENLASIVAMGRAIELAAEELPREAQRLAALREEMIALAREKIPGVVLNGHPSERLPNNVNLRIPDLTSEAALYNLDMAGIACSSGSACTAGSLSPSHVLMAMGLSKKEARGALRFTFSRYTTREEVFQAVEKLAEIADRLRIQKI